MKRRKLPKRSSKDSYNESESIAEMKRGLDQQEKEHVLFEGEHDDDCYICDIGGDLVCCDYCSKAFHLDCHIPPLKRVPQGEFMCCECKAIGECV